MARVDVGRNLGLHRERAVRVWESHGTVGRRRLSRGALRRVGRLLGGRGVRIQICVGVLVWTAVAASASLANSRGAYEVDNSGCGGTCNLRGTQADITWPAKFNILSGNAGNEGLIFNSTNVNKAFIQVGAIQFNSLPGTDCDASDTNGNLRNFYETADLLGNGFCHVVTSSTPGGETHNYKDQRRKDADCGSVLPPCASGWIDGTFKATAPMTQDYGKFISSQGELDVDSNFNTNTAVSAAWPGAGSVHWSRTSDKFGNAQTWTAIGSAPSGWAGSTGDHWFCGSIAGGFSIYFVYSTSNATC
jgi:hypothetical protein